GNHKKKDWVKAGESQPASSDAKQVLGDIEKGTTPTPTLDSGVSTVDNNKADRELKEDMVISIPYVEDDGEVLHTVRVEYEWEPPRCGVHFKPEKPVWQAVSKKNNVSSSGTKPIYEVSRKVVSLSKPFYALITI
nr:reverse transcriptase domain-containing protein [Tanacetum cinerariifolium]